MSEEETCTCEGWDAVGLELAAQLENIIAAIILCVLIWAIWRS